MNTIRSFSEAYEFLVEAVPKTSNATFKGKRGFIKSKRWMQELGNPQNAVPAIHIAGTSGKGTVAHLISAILECHGKKTALITSPHAYDIRERILIRREKLSKANFVKIVKALLPAYEKMKRAGSPPSYFEMIMAMGFVAGAKNKIDYCVVETGMGGKLDTSNTIARPDKLCVITPIGYDHMHILGSTLRKIAFQKVGIVQKHQRVFSANQSREPMQAIRSGCKKAQAELSISNAQKTLKKYGVANLSKLNSQLSGTYSRSNLALSIESVEYVAERDGWVIKPRLIKQAIKTFKIPGRFEIVHSAGGKEFIFDGAHNEQKLAALVDAANERYGNKKVGLVFASSKENPAGKLKIVKKISDTIILTQYHSKELDMVRPQPNLAPFANNKNIFYIPNTKDVVSYIKSSDIKNWIITGSFFLLKEIRGLVRKKTRKISL